MSSTQKYLTVALWSVFVLAMISVIAGQWWLRPSDRSAMAVRVSHDAPSSPLDPKGEVPEFKLVDQDNKPITRDSLRGHAWVGAFIFTHCAGPCPMMTARMTAMQKSIANPDVHLVTFTVDPERDTPDVLKRYAAEHEADQSRWHFLTGDKEAIYALARGMFLTALPAIDDKSPIIHDERFVLVDAEGKIRRFYHMQDLDQMEHLTSDAQSLAARTK